MVVFNRVFVACHQLNYVFFLFLLVADSGIVVIIMLMSSFPPESVEKIYRMFSLVRSRKLHTINYQGATIQLLLGGGGWALVFDPDTF